MLELLGLKNKLCLLVVGMKLELIRNFNFIVKIKNSKSGLLKGYNYNF